MEIRNMRYRSVLRAKYLIVKKYINGEEVEWKTLIPIALIDKQFYLICRAFCIYNNVDQFLERFNDEELELSFNTVRLDDVINNIVNGPDFVIVEPILPNGFIDDIVDVFLRLEDANVNLSAVNVPVHTYLHRIWKKAACSEIRPRKQLSGKLCNSVFNDISLQCKCSNDYLMDVFIIYNYTINKKMNVEIYYTKRFLKFAVRFVRIYFSNMEPLYVRSRPRLLPFDVLFDIGTFLTRTDLDICQLVSREWYNIIESNRNGFALHNKTSAKLVSKGDLFCFGVFDEDESTSNVVDFRERRCNSAVIEKLFYPLMRNSSIDKFHIKRIDIKAVFESFVDGISRCLPTNIKRLVFSAALVDRLEHVFDFSENTLKIKEYEVEVFSEELFKRLLSEPAVQRCDRLVLYEQYQSNQTILNEVASFFGAVPRPACTFVMRNVINEQNVNAILSTVIRSFQRSKKSAGFINPMLLVLHKQPNELPQCCTNPVHVNVPDAFSFETPTVSNIYHFENSIGETITFCIGQTVYHPVRRICHFQYGKN
ncbi:unnamed protein product [Bursaphelenchus okinawaensis]|uniref:F-box domain-containing protein n=1 Tax=Bursaphelenchus okinawaensis TaxID=465554 RepID=A0A811LCM9_9BILA|nr:unnamed protein product [Bursaphelenchus okinawaensis]CAG9120235.1 unnamed protein product [Bursaphelenchus okinawaensis]